MAIRAIKKPGRGGWCGQVRVLRGAWYPHPLYALTFRVPHAYAHQLPSPGLPTATLYKNGFVYARVRFCATLETFTDCGSEVQQKFSRKARANR